MRIWRLCPPHEPPNLARWELQRHLFLRLSHGFRMRAAAGCAAVRGGALVRLYVDGVLLKDELEP